MNGARNDRSDRDIEVHVRNFLHLLGLEGGRNLALLSGGGAAPAAPLESAVVPALESVEDLAAPAF